MEIVLRNRKQSKYLLSYETLNNSPSKFMHISSILFHPQILAIVSRYLFSDWSIREFLFPKFFNLIEKSSSDFYLLHSDAQLQQVAVCRSQLRKITKISSSTPQFDVSVPTDTFVVNWSGLLLDRPTYRRSWDEIRLDLQSTSLRDRCKKTKMRRSSRHFAAEQKL